MYGDFTGGRLEGKARILLAWDLYLLNDYVEMLSVLDSAAELITEQHENALWRAIGYQGIPREAQLHKEVEVPF